MNTNQQQWLRRMDPLNEDPGIVPTVAQEMRRTVLGAVQSSSTPLPFSQALAVAIVVLTMLGAGVFAGRQLPDRPLNADGPEVGGGGGPRQFQFAMPGGTRIIWVFDPDFTLKETIP